MGVPTILTTDGTCDGCGATGQHESGCRELGGANRMILNTDSALGTTRQHEKGCRELRQLVSMMTCPHKDAVTYRILAPETSDGATVYRSYDCDLCHSKIRQVVEDAYTDGTRFYHAICVKRIEEFNARKLQKEKTNGTRD